MEAVVKCEESEPVGVACSSEEDVVSSTDTTLGESEGTDFQSDNMIGDRKGS